MKLTDGENVAAALIISGAFTTTIVVLDYIFSYFFPEAMLMDTLVHYRDVFFYVAVGAWIRG